MGIDIDEHLDFLIKTCFEVEAQLILEFGVNEGASTRAFLSAARILNARVISIDIDDCSKVSDDPHWTFYQMDDLFFNINEPIDVLFIDTSHTYKQTLKELRKFAPKVKSGGVILLHDTISCPDVYKAICKYIQEEPNYKLEHHEYCNGLGILWKLR